jgi:signal peptidase II
MASKKLYFRYSLFGIFAILIVVFDQLTKLFIENNFVTGQTKEIIPKILNFTYILNEGAAFGIMQGRKIAFIIITIAVFAAAFFCFKKYKPSSILALLSASFILSGAVGNLIDRVRFGYVRDFIDVAFMNFPVFNIADCAICVGAFLLILYALFDIGRAK